jgi:hypothetical protein
LVKFVIETASPPVVKTCGVTSSVTQDALEVVVDGVVQILGLAAWPPLANASSDAMTAVAATAAARPGLIHWFFGTVRTPLQIRRQMASALGAL